MKILTTVIFGIKQSLQEVKYRFIFAGAALFVFFLFVLIPTVSVPGNDFFYQLSLFSTLDFGVTVLLSILYAVFITMQVYVMRMKKQMSDIGTTVGGGIGTIFAGVAGTAFCASCLAPLFALFGIGFGGVLFILKFRFYFVAGIVVLMLIAIYLLARKIQRTCATC